VQYYGRAPIPTAVLLGPDMVETTEALEEVLAGKVDRAVKVRAPVRGPEGDAVKIAMDNAAQLLREALASQTARDRALSRVAELVGAPRPPRRIEGFDMSTFQAAEPVGSMVVFVDGRPEKRSYRTFAIRLEEGPGDVGFMKEVLKRRFSKLGEDDRPDLVMLDGGESQLAVAREVWRDLGLDIPLVALAKSRVAGKGFGAAEHTPERLFVPAEAGGADGIVGGVREGGPATLDGALEGTPERPGARRTDARLIVPPQNDPGLHLLMRVRDEAHRFAVAFHRKRRGKKEVGSVLDAIPGLGKTRRTALLRHFGSVSAIRAATLDELRAAPGLPGPVAQVLFDKLHG
jgi:excinuclease ABC subunit C